MNRNCRECGRYLPSLRSQRKGIGPKCIKKVRERLASGFKKDQAQRAFQLRKDRQVKRVRPGIYRVKGYLTARNACSCPGGVYRPHDGSCYHQLAVRLEEVARV